MPVDISGILSALNMLHQSNVQSSQTAAANQQKRAGAIGQVTGLLGMGAGYYFGGPLGAGLGGAIGQGLGSSLSGGPPVQPMDIANIGMQTYSLQQQQEAKAAQAAMVGGLARQQAGALNAQPFDPNGGDAYKGPVPTERQNKLGLLQSLQDPKVAANLNPAMVGMLFKPEFHEVTPGSTLMGSTLLGGMQKAAGGASLKIFTPEQTKALGYGPGVTAAAYVDDKGNMVAPPHIVHDQMQNMSQDAKDDLQAATENAKDSKDIQPLYMHYRATRNAVPRPGGFDAEGNPRTVSSIRYDNATDNFYSGSGVKPEDASFSPPPIRRAGSSIPTTQPRVGAVAPPMTPEQMQSVGQSLNALEGLDNMKGLVDATGPIANMDWIKKAKDIVHLPDERLRAFNSEATTQSPMLKQWVSRVAALDWNIDAMVGMFPDGNMRPEVNAYRLGRLTEMGKNSIQAEVENLKYHNVTIPPAYAQRLEAQGINVGRVKGIDHTNDPRGSGGGFAIGGSRTNPMILSDEEFGKFKADPISYSKSHPRSWIKYNGVIKQLGTGE